MKISLILFGMLLLTALVGATDEGIYLKLNNNSLYVEGYTWTTFAGKVQAAFLDPKTFYFENPLICEHFSIGSENYTKNCRLNLNLEKDVLLTAYNQSGGYVFKDINSYNQLQNCLYDKNDFNSRLNVCKNELTIMRNEQGNLSICMSDLNVWKSKATEAKNEKLSCEQEIEDNKNSNVTWGVLGIIIGLIGGMYLKDPLRKLTHKELDHELNRVQAV